MQQEKVDALFVHFMDLVPQEKKLILKRKLENASDDRYLQLTQVKTHNPTTALVISIFFGGLGVDRFMLGDVGLGICKLLFGGLTFGLWYLIDLFLISKRTKTINYDKIIELLM